MSIVNAHFKRAFVSDALEVVRSYLRTNYPTHVAEIALSDRSIKLRTRSFKREIEYQREGFLTIKTTLNYSSKHLPKGELGELVFEFYTDKYGKIVGVCLIHPKGIQPMAYTREQEADLRRTFSRLHSSLASVSQALKEEEFDVLVEPRVSVIKTEDSELRFSTANGKLMLGSSNYRGVGGKELKQLVKEGKI